MSSGSGLSDMRWIREALKEYPEVQTELDPSREPRGIHWLDIWKGPGQFMTIEWRRDKGFGFFTGRAKYGQSPETFEPTKEAALERILRTVSKW